MSRALCLLLCFSSVAFAQTLNRSSEPPSSPGAAVEVFYVLNDSTLTTYNIDPQTFEPTAVGTTVLPTSKYPGLLTSPNGQFLYYLTNVDYYLGTREIYVYDTDAEGVPASAPVQTINAGHLAGLLVNPGGAFLYSVHVGPVDPDQQTTQFTILRNVIDPANGKLRPSVTEATYQIETGSSSNDCYLSVLSFNPAGTIMYDGILCSGPHGSGSSTYNQRSVDLQTGALGPDQQIYNFSYYAGSGYANVQIENNVMFAFVAYFNQGPNADVIDVYQLPNSSPTVNCTASTWAICGDFGFALAHPSGQYVSLQESNGVTVIEQVNLATQQLVQVNTLGFGVEAFSPNGKIAYGLRQTSPHEIRIAGFNPANGGAKMGGTIQLTHAYDHWIPAERY